MHSYIIQLSDEPIPDEQLTDLEDYYDAVSYNSGLHDYVSRINKPEYQHAIDELVDLMRDYLKIVGEHELEVIADCTPLMIQAINEVVSVMPDATDKKSTWGNIRDLRAMLRNPLQTDLLFTIAGYGVDCMSDSLLDFMSQLNVGDKIYIGTIINYHY